MRSIVLSEPDLTRNNVAPAYRATLLHTIVTASNFAFVPYFRFRCLVVIGTWFNAKSLLLSNTFYPQILLRFDND
jgi:hypothetical protein